MIATTAEQSSTTVVIDEADLRAGIAVIEQCDNVQRWIARGKPVDDIEMEVSNTMNCAQFRVHYQKMRDKFCQQYDIPERELNRRLLQYMAR